MKAHYIAYSMIGLFLLLAYFVPHFMVIVTVLFFYLASEDDMI